MIDLHAHVLPALDDGPAGTPEALALARAASAAGVTTIVATPHIDLRHDVRPGQVRGAVVELNAALEEAGVALDVLPGGEIALERLLDLPAQELRQVTLGGGDCLLVEPPLRRIPGDFAWPIRDLCRGSEFRVLIAHPERCPGFLEAPERLEELVAEGALCQITVGGLLGTAGPRARAFALFALSAGLVHNVATDAHDVERRPPALDAGVAALRDAGCSEGRIAWMTDGVPRALIASRPTPEPPHDRHAGTSSGAVR